MEPWSTAISGVSRGQWSREVGQEKDFRRLSFAYFPFFFPLTFFFFTNGALLRAD